MNGDAYIGISVMKVSRANMVFGDVENMGNCCITHVLINSHEYLVKQHFAKGYQIGTVRDALAAYVSKDLNIMQHSEIIPMDMNMKGKHTQSWPASVVTVMAGDAIRDRTVGLEGDSIDINNISIEQGYMKGLDRQGLTRYVIGNMSLHPHLATIVGIDIMIGYRDRHWGNLLYDGETNSFAGIDMDDSWEQDSCKLAIKNLCRMIRISDKFTANELRSLKEVRRVILHMLKRFRSSHLIYKLNYFSVKAGLTDDSPLNTETISEQLDEYAMNIAQSWLSARHLVDVLNFMIEGSDPGFVEDICVPFR